ncbi:pantoate--beta-alanine ligase [Pseudidiomarina taiwanensis]|uniref:Pantothenate synthetase n=1 Tax=Pseudidiomarina taiwanensis TaxID=337250 RepID=A0A432ZC77_9GAMM|nr:pantoate--beta-alanine ligase [Pseudidiomarina taiwanensis]RUO75573.1 pantoate--beta-alanine ligase [Pseudidiomarina taiwanensis]
MLVFTDLASFRAWRQQQTARIGFVPTMGNLHQGHLELVKVAQQHADQVVVSIFVNPMQFGQNEDLDAYPRTFAEDCTALEQLGVAAVFAPTVADMYPRGLTEQTTVQVPHISDILCGASRPGHFIGVATVVCKLFNMVQPDVAVFGQKDYQQLQVIKLMVADLSMPVDIIGVPTQRADDGLALSSRNGYLNANERATAPRLYQVLQQLAERIRAGKEVDAELAAATKTLTQAGFEVDYLSVRRQLDLAPISASDSELVILAAARLGSTRLIDNLAFTRK